VPVKIETTPPLPRLSPVASKPVIARFDGRQFSSDADVLALREIVQWLGTAKCTAARIADLRCWHALLV
jgi:hypothetical protein